MVCFAETITFLLGTIMGPINVLQQTLTNIFLYLYQVLQWFLDKLLSPTPPPPHANLGRPKIAIIGAGLTGVAAASHCVGHGFDCRIFEKGPRKHLGGIWAVSSLYSY